MPKNKTDNFLKAIKKYAKAQKTAMQSEVNQLKTERLKDAEEKAKLDSERLIKEKLLESRSRQSAILASETQEGNRKLYIERSAMVDEVFQMAAERLIEYTETDAYCSDLEKSAREIAELFEGRECVLYVNEKDLQKTQSLVSVFDGKARVETDKRIKIGGVRGYCESMGIIADETLDSKLEAQREWFVENAALSVI